MRHYAYLEHLEKATTYPHGEGWGRNDSYMDNQPASTYNCYWNQCYNPGDSGDFGDTRDYYDIYDTRSIIKPLLYPINVFKSRLIVYNEGTIRLVSELQNK